MFHAGTAKNIIAQTAKIAGTIRCQREETRAWIIKDMENIVKGICAGYGADCQIDVLRGLPVLINEKEANLMIAAISDNTLKDVINRDYLRAKIFKNMLIKI